MRPYAIGFQGLEKSVGPYAIEFQGLEKPARLYVMEFQTSESPSGFFGVSGFSDFHHETVRQLGIFKECLAGAFAALPELLPVAGKP